MTAKKEGQIKVKAYFTGSKWVYIYYVTISRSPNGTYFIQNKQHSKYLQTSNNSKITELWDFDGDSHQRWEILHVSGGYYKIRSESLNKYVSVASGSTNTDNCALVFEDYKGYDRQLWKIRLNKRGNYVFYPKSAPSDKNFCMGAGDYFILGNGLNVNQRLYTDDTELRDEWELSVLANHPEILNGHHVPDIRFAIKCCDNLSQSEHWNRLIVESANAWNDAVGTSITIITSTDTSITNVYLLSMVQRPDVTWAGQTTCTSSGGVLIMASIEINTVLCKGSDNVKKSTITHEIGHILGLSDNPPIADNSTLMSQERNRSEVYLPKPYDIYNVKYIYGLN